MKRNIIFVLFFGFSLCLALFIFSSLRDRHILRGQLESRDREIGILTDKIKESEKIADYREKEARKWELAAQRKEVDMEKGEAEIERLKAEGAELRERIQAMPPSEVVLRTREIIRSEEIQEQPQGIVFSIRAARENMKYLEDFTLLKSQLSLFELNYNICKLALGDRMKEALNLETVILEKDKQLLNKDEIIINWKEKFSLIEQSKKKEFWRTFGIGAAVGGGIILVLFLAR